MKTKAQKWGNSLAVRVPKGITEQAGVGVNDVLDIEVAKDGVICLRPRRRQKYRLNDLLKGMTKENMPSEIGFGRPVGREVW
jgi:antitoxin MazE